MSRFENRLPPEGINVSKSNPLVEVFWLLMGVVLSVVTFVVLLYLMGSLLARHIPFAWETKLTDLTYFQSLSGKAYDPRSLALQRIADDLAKGLELPKDMRFRVSFVDDEEVNAFATIGGHISIHRGLIERLTSENALAMVIAHEMGHIMHRDPADAMGGRLAVGLAMLLLAPVIGVDGLQTVVGTTQNLALMTFSREAEARADEAGVALLARKYGHLGGAREVFEALASYEDKYGLLVAPELLSTHPDTKRRAELVPMQAQKLKVPETGEVRPLPMVLKRKD